LNAVERILPIVRDGCLSLLTVQRLSKFQAALRSAGLAEATIKGHLGHLLAALAWAKRMEMLAKIPDVQMPARARSSKMMKGRAISQEEFERMLVATRAIVGEDAAPSWRYLLKGLWLSGLRLGEAVDLWWDRDDRLCVVENGDHLAILVHAELEKGKEDRKLTIAPEFEDFLNQTPRCDRTGLVFRPMSRHERDAQMGAGHIGKIICAIGRKAGVKVMTKPRTGQPKFASAHDLRRAFGTRWSKLVKPVRLQLLMRHKEIETTLKYYVDQEAGDFADELRRAVAGPAAGAAKSADFWAGSALVDTLGDTLSDSL
jgi:integrase